METITRIIHPVHREGYPFIAIFALATILLLALFEPLGWIGVVLTLWCVYFFRDPERVTPEGENLVISPADGVVEKIADVVPPKELELGEEPLTRVSVFMNVFNVHVNRSPVGGKVTKMHYHPGKFFNATLDKASEENERQLLRITDVKDRHFGVIQIAGLVARRIVCEVGEDSTLEAGERFGIIRFGSRVDVFLPKGIAPLVVEGQLSVAGETVLADMEGEQKPRRGAKQ